jgi:hypothetical protein
MPSLGVFGRIFTRELTSVVRYYLQLKAVCQLRECKASQVKEKDNQFELRNMREESAKSPTMTGRPIASTICIRPMDVVVI